MNDYEEQQRIRDTEYEAAWKNLTKRQRRELEKAGITGPEIPKYRTGKHDDVALIENVPASEPSINPEESIDDLDIENIREAGELLKAFLFRIIDESKNPRLEAECISLAFGYGAAKGISQTAIAARYGLTRAAVSKRVREIKDAFELPVSEFMKSDRARAVYALTNRARA